MHCGFTIKTGYSISHAEQTSVYPFTDEAQTALFKAPVRTAL